MLLLKASQPSEKVLLEQVCGWLCPPSPGASPTPFLEEMKGHRTLSNPPSLQGWGVGTGEQSILPLTLPPSVLVFGGDMIHFLPVTLGLIWTGEQSDCNIFRDNSRGEHTARMLTPLPTTQLFTAFTEGVSLSCCVTQFPFLTLQKDTEHRVWRPGACKRELVQQACDNDRKNTW